MKSSAKALRILLGLVACIVIGGIILFALPGKESKTSEIKDASPLAGKRFYNDPQRPVSLLAAQYKREGKTAEADLVEKISSRPGSTWLTGPHAADPTANKDITEVQRTSQAAIASGTLPVYIVYAIPNRDACAGFSQGGFSSHSDYLAWIDRIVAAARTKSVYVVEPDAIGHTIADNCLNDQQREERYALLSAVVSRLQASQNTQAIYLDAGNPEWFKNPEALVSPLKKSGLSQARGVAVNVSSFIDTGQVTRWTEQLTAKLGSNKGVVIDTSRNGNGAPDANVTGTARWCNPPGRAIGPIPTTDVSAAHVDAYIWGKNIGDSDGDCFGNPPAGTFVPASALELARNAR